MRRSTVRPAMAGLFAALSVIGVGLATTSSSAAGTNGGHPRASAKLTGADLVSYNNCSQLLRQVKAEAMKEVGPYGLSGSSGGSLLFPPGGVVRGAVPMPTELGSNAPGSAPPSTAATPAGANGTAGQGYSTTNDQEAGVDEPDMVKTNGQVMVVLRQDPLGVQVVDVSGSAPKLDGFLPLSQLEQASGLFLSGQDVYVIGGGTSGPIPVRYVGGPRPTAKSQGVGGPATVSRSAPLTSMPLLPWGGYTSSTDVVVVSVADPENPAVVRTFSFQGAEQGARLINGQVVLALTNQPRLRWVYPFNATPAADKAATAANRA